MLKKAFNLLNKIQFVQLLAEPLDCTGGTLGFRGTLVENHCVSDLLFQSILLISPKTAFNHVFTVIISKENKFFNYFSIMVSFDFPKERSFLKLVSRIIPLV